MTAQSHSQGLFTHGVLNRSIAHLTARFIGFYSKQCIYEKRTEKPVTTPFCPFLDRHH